MNKRIYNLTIGINILGLFLIAFFAINRNNSDCNTSKSVNDNVSGVSVYDTIGSDNEKDWIKINDVSYKPSSPLNIVIENNFVRIDYPESGKAPEQKGFQRWYMKNSGGKYIEITDSSYGDYTYYIDTVKNPPDSVSFYHISNNRVVVDFHYDSHYVYRESNLPEDIVFGKEPFIKRVEMDSDSRGAYLDYISDDTNPNGEKEFSLGMGKNIFYGVSNSWIWDFYRGSETSEMPKSDYYLGFSDQNNLGYYYFLSAPKETSIYMYRFKGLWGGPIVRSFPENPKSKGIFFGIIPYDETFTEKAELLKNKDALAIEDSAELAGDNFLELREGEQISIFPENFVKSGQYKIEMRYKGSQAEVELFDGRNKNAIEIKPSNEFTNLVIFDRINHDPERRYYLKVNKGEITLDNFYYIPLKSKDGLFPENIMEKINFDSE